MAGLWLIVCLLTICLYHDLHVIILKLKVMDEPTVNQKDENITTTVPFTPPILRRKEEYITPNDSSAYTSISTHYGAQSAEAFYSPAQSFESAKYGSIISSQRNSFEECGHESDLQVYSSDNNAIVSDENEDDNFYSVLNTSTEIMETAEHFIISGATDPGLLSRTNSSGRISAIQEEQENSQIVESIHSDDNKQKITLRYLYDGKLKECNYIQGHSASYSCT